MNLAVLLDLVCMKCFVEQMLLAINEHNLLLWELFPYIIKGEFYICTFVSFHFFLQLLVFAVLYRFIHYFRVNVSR